MNDGGNVFANLCNVTTSKPHVNFCVMLWLFVVSVFLTVYTNLHDVYSLTLASTVLSLCNATHVRAEMD